MKYFKEIAQKKGATYGRGPFYEAKPGDVTSIIVTKSKPDHFGYKVIRVYSILGGPYDDPYIQYIYPDQDTNDSYWRFVEISKREAFALML